MNIEQRLQSAANELNHVSRRSAPPALGMAGETVRPWLAFTAAFAVVVAVVGIPYAIANFGQGAPPDSGPLAGIETTTTAAPTTTDTQPTSTGSGFECEASGLPVPTTAAPTEEAIVLPDAVAQKAFRIASAARVCDYNALAELAAENITTSYGGGGIENLAWWHDEGRSEYATLVNVLSTTHAVTEMPDGEALYVWPAAFAYDTWDEIPDDLLAELLRIHTEEELDTISQFGGYAGWRVGITQSGEWIFFVAGD